MNAMTQSELDYFRIEKAIRYLNDHMTGQPRLEDVAVYAGVSPYHFQRLFSRWAGVSPKRFLELLTLRHAAEILKSGSATVADAASDTRLSGTERPHDLFVTLEAMTPGEYKAQGRPLEIRYGFHPTPFGRALICITQRGVCGLSFVDGDQDAEALAYHKGRRPLSEFTQSAAETADYIEQIFAKDTFGEPSIHCIVTGTSFQCKVWEALLAIPPGSVSTYSSIAALAGSPAAVRAAGNAVGLNPVAYLIPCHRVIKASGVLGGYRWGPVRKQAMIARESAFTCRDTGPDCTTTVSDK